MCIDIHNFELKLEITEKCNSRCTFCHQSFGARRSARQMPYEIAAHWIQWAKAQNIGAIRLTGGEPTLHQDLKKICALASESGLHVTVNTNGFATSKYYDQLYPFVKVLKISIPLILADDLDRITGIKGSLQKKLKVVTRAIDLGFDVEILTVMLAENLEVIEEYVLFVKDVPSLSWVPLRQESSAGNLRPITRELIQKLAVSWKKLMGMYPDDMPKLRLATPFCAVDPIDLGAEVFSGRREGCGPFKSVTVDVDGGLFACYSCRTPFRKKSSLADISRDPEYLRLTTTDRLPQKCLSCRYVDTCMGGCASPYALVSLQGKEIDYLAK